MELLRIDFLEGDPAVLYIAGDLDVGTADELAAKLADALSTNPEVVIDLAGVTFCDASGLRALVGAATSRNGTGPLTLRNARRVQRLLDLVGLSELSSIVIEAGSDARDR